ncbi:hypothetical protein DB313_04835 (plasmid) [Borrelia turcica IST7]|uniref:Phage tail protein n=1 Tax=Borrelia turcica IST7 TaxID=1104446 RepID=A0A386PPR2_9SPIR|nr:DUF787 family protein [Borrelia turcica]AYE36827.1 hypothetical protein DB313_04835 [Borrelia turcica IST7]
MPQDTINVNLIENKVKLNDVGYYNPLLIYKSDCLSEGHFVLNVSGFKDSIASLKLRQEISSDESRKKTAETQRTLLAKSFSALFASEGLKSVDFYIYKDIKEVAKYLREHVHTFVVFVDEVADDALKSDFEALEGLSKFMVLSTKSKDLPKELKDKNASELDGVILVYVGDNEHLHLKFVSKYLHQASIFHSVNPYGITLKANPIYDATLISSLRKNNINFYSLLNETGRDGVLAFKEGVDVAGNPIDEAFTYHLLKTEATRELIRIWSRNNRQNSKLSQLKVKEGNNAYTAGLECLFKGFRDAGLIVSFSDIKLELKASSGLALDLSIRVKYNDSFKSVILNISSDDINDYLKKEAV